MLLQPLLTLPGREEKAMLSVSSLVNSYCRINPNCGNDEEVGDIISTLEQNIGYGCRVTDSNRKKVCFIIITYNYYLFKQMPVSPDACFKI
jgi:hypothetical protein